MDKAMTNKLFDDFFDYELTPHKRAVTPGGPRRRSGTIEGTVKHGFVHTPSPDSTIHHIVTAECPHPERERAKAGDSYRVAYISIPAEWLDKIDTAVRIRWDISFIGPSSTVQKIPPRMGDFEEMLRDTIYIGFDWLWLTKGNPALQPSIPKIRDKLIEFATEIRRLNNDGTSATNGSDLSSGVGEAQGSLDFGGTDRT